MPSIEITKTHEIKILQHGHALVGTHHKGADKVIVNSCGEGAASDIHLDADEAEELGKWLVGVAKEMRG